ncbi:hypothetical protein LptCag_1652 [Leptospirillum ferriphilum]|uniref:Uncharacterized protein n=1 Tax=Leptospirillum ferriphilum TaxID=178606 RepID=A0A094W5S5_9BACT|nr:hypothetical protein LptCag_1652 [Leptospirillum ferriphilum]
MKNTVGFRFFRTCFRGRREKHVFVMVLSFFFFPFWLLPKIPLSCLQARLFRGT